ncbi:MAG: CHAT domain-containing tetratricopeptide repeat protein [Planctomycetota bacterium]|jgi:CHAT domain-containing protein
MMTCQELAEQLLALPDTEAQRRFLEQHVSSLDESLANALKEQANRFLRSDLRRSLEAAALLCYMTELTGNPLFHALGLLAEANARSIGGLGEHKRAIELYDKAAEIYHTHDLVVEQARSQVGKVFSLAMLGLYEDAQEIGCWAQDILESHHQWLSLATLTMNLAVAYGRQRDDSRALAQFDQASQIYEQLGAQGKRALPWVEHNRAMVLRNLGRFEASIEASQSAYEELTRQEQTASAAKAQEGLALTYLILGRYNEALALLDQARDLFLADGRRSNAVQAELFTSYCLLQLRRFGEVLDKCRQQWDLFAETGMRREMAEAALNEAMAYAGLERHPEALESLAKARHLFVQEGNPVWITGTDLELSTVLYHLGRFEDCLAAAQECAGAFRAHDLPVQESDACLLAARSAIALHQQDLALELVTRALDIAQDTNIPSQVYQCHYLLGVLAEEQAKWQDALAAYDRAIQELERLCGRMMVEFRANYLEDKVVVYEDMVALCLDLDRPSLGLEYAERAKSRALLDLLAYRLDMRIHARDVADTDLVAELTRLRSERDRLYRRWRTSKGLETRGWSSVDGGRQQAQPDVLHLEKRIAALWHRLLIRNADYARDASLWHVRAEPIQPYLSAETLLLEYFCSRGQLVAFLLTAENVQARRLPVDLSKVQRLIQLLSLNLGTVAKSRPSLVSSLTANARGLLRQLHELLLAPLADAMAQYPQLVIVPHGPLHYLPFHALYDGQSYLLEQHTISYLPVASLLRYCQNERTEASDIVVFGHSYGGALPHAVHEAQAISEIFGGCPVLEDEATPDQLRSMVTKGRILHLAAHGDFRPDNPLFSGLALSGGWLTTLDVFGLSLKASLVTLSACQTGRNVVGGGDELLGLMRAFLYAGASSLVLTQWAVEDRSTAQLMTTFYTKLAEGWSKGSALRCAQLEFIESQRNRQDATSNQYAHPYYWAPFFLVGDAGPL